MISTWRARVAVMGLLLVAFLGGNCNQDPPGYGVLVIGVRTAIPSVPSTLAGGMGETLAGLTALTATVSRIDVALRTVANDPSTEKLITVDTTPATITLSGSLSDAGARLLASLNVPHGFVSEIRFIIASAAITVHGTTFPVTVPSGAHTGLKVEPIDGIPFEISDGERTGARIVFQPFIELLRNQGKGFQLKPVAEAEHVSLADISPVLLDRMIVGFKAGTAASTIANINSAMGTTIINAWVPTNLYVLHVPTTTTIEDAVNYYLGQSEVEYALPDIVMSPRGSIFPCNSAFQNPGPFTAANFPPAWGLTTGKPSVTTTAVVDDGFDLQNPSLLFNWYINTTEADVPSRQSFFGCNFAPDFNKNGVRDYEDINQYYWGGNNGYSFPYFADTYPNTPDGIMSPMDLVCTSGVCLPGKISFYDGKDPDGNTLVMDFTGYDFGSGDNVPNFDLASPSGSVDGAPASTAATHGTSVAGVLAGVGRQTGCGPGDRVAGAEWSTRLLPIKASDPTITMGASAQQLMSSIFIGINYAAMMKSTVINVSAGMAATRNALSTYGLQTCTDAVIGGVGQKKFNLLTQEAGKAVAALNLKWPGGSGSSVLVVAAPNCPMTIAANDPDFYDIWMSGRSSAQPIIVVGGLGIQKTFVDADFTARGDLVDIGAPATGFNVLNFRQLTGIDTNATGNSFAAPLVAGAIGLMVSYDPTLSGQADKLKSRLLCNSPSTIGIDFAGQRVLDAFRAVGNGNACP